MGADGGENAEFAGSVFGDVNDFFGNVLAPAVDLLNLDRLRDGLVAVDVGDRPGVGPLGFGGLDGEWEKCKANQRRRENGGDGCAAQTEQPADVRASCGFCRRGSGMTQKN